MPIAIWFKGPLSGWLYALATFHHCCHGEDCCHITPAAEASGYHSAQDSAERGPGALSPETFNIQQKQPTTNTLTHLLLTVCSSLLYTVCILTLTRTPTKPTAPPCYYNTVTPLLGITDYPRHPPNTHRTVRTGSLPVTPLTVHTGSGAHSRALTPLRNVVTILSHSHDDFKGGCEFPERTG